MAAHGNGHGGKHDDHGVGHGGAHGSGHDAHGAGHGNGHDDHGGGHHGPQLTPAMRGYSVFCYIVAIVGVTYFAASQFGEGDTTTGLLCLAADAVLIVLAVRRASGG